MSSTATPRSRFTPSTMPADVLERLFVARAPLLSRIMQRIEAAAHSSERNHTLLVGPRGSGKTHLVSLAYHRARAGQQQGLRLQLAWLAEDPWTIVSYGHLLRAIADRLEPAVQRPLPRDTGELEALLTRRAAQAGPTVVILENLDWVLGAIGNEGQQRLRHLLQAERSLLLLATSTRIDHVLSAQDEPFYGFFTTTRLQPFDVESAAAMLKAISTESDDRTLVSYLDTREGRSRLQTIAHLAGGQPRVWSLLASALTISGLSSLVDLLLSQFDDLTPYYQEQLGRLSPQQRLAVAELAVTDRPMSVGELATRIEVDQRSLAKTISELVDRGWVTPTTSSLTARLDRRRSYYELAEPLARIVFQIKEARGRPVELVVEFLKHWFDPDALTRSSSEQSDYVALATLGQAGDPVVAVTRRLRGLPRTRAPMVELLGVVDDALASLAADDPEPLLRLPTPIRVALESRLDEDGTDAVRFDVHSAARAEFGLIRRAEMERWIARSQQWLRTQTSSDVRGPQIALTLWLASAWRFGEADQALATLAEVADTTLATAASVADYARFAGRVHDAVTRLEGLVRVVDASPATDEAVALRIRRSLAVSYLEAGEAARAVDLLESVTQDAERHFGGAHPETIFTRQVLAGGYRALGRHEEALALYADVLAREEGAAARGRSLVHARCLVASSQLALGRAEEAAALLEATWDERASLPQPSDVLEVGVLLAAARVNSGLVPEGLALLRRVAEETERTLGEDDPDLILARVGLATTYLMTGRGEEAILTLEAAAEMISRILGERHPITLFVRDKLVDVLADGGRAQDSRALAAVVVTASRETLGDDHPDTVTRRAKVARLAAEPGRGESEP